jgi:hypothetical protein
MIRIMIILAMLLLAGTADARLTMGVWGPASSGGQSSGGGCSNSANLGQACNSAIGAAIIGGFL